MPDIKAILEKANARVAAGDNEGFLAHVTEDTVWHFIGDRTLEGKDAVRAYMKETYVKPPVFNTDNMIADGENLAVHGKITLEDADGKKTTSSYCDVWRFQGDKLHELRAYVVEG